MSERRKILLVTRNLPPLRGGMERLNQHIAIELAAGADVVVIGPEGCRAHLPESIDVIEIPTRPLWRFLLRSAAAAWHEGGKRVSLIVAGSGLTGPAALLASYRSRARCAAYVHGLDIVARHPVYRWLWMPLLGRLDAAFANSASTAELARHAGVARGNVLVLNPGTEFPELTTPDANEFRDDYKVGDGPMLLSVGRLTERKGLREFIELAMPKIVAAYPTAKLVVIGDDATNALHQGNAHVASRVMEEVASQGLHANVVRLGPCDDETLHRAYLEADVHVFPVRDIPGDIEGFGMVAVEAAARGLPTVAFPVGGVSDAVSDGVSGYLPTPGDYDGFAARVCQVLAEGRAGRLRGSARNFARQFAWDCFGERLRRMADEVADA